MTTMMTTMMTTTMTSGAATCATATCDRAKKVCRAVEATRLCTFLLCATALMTALAPAALTAQSAEDHAAVERTALDYLEGFYEGSEEKIRRGVHPDVVKTGFFVVAGAYEQEPMSFHEMVEYANSVRDSGRTPPASAPKRVEVLDVLDQTAVAKVYAWWGSDYLSMAKYGGEWKIVQVLWQSAPAR
jgi:Putative lumazine-binding